MLILKDRKVDLAHVALSPDGTRLAACGLRGPLQLWDVAGRRLAWKVPSESYFRAVSFTPGGGVIALEDDAGVCLFDSADGARVESPSLGTDAWAAAFSSDGRGACLCTSEFDPERVVLSWHALPGGEVAWTADLPGTVGEVALACARKSPLLAVSKPSGSVHLFDTTSGARRGQVGDDGGPAVHSVALSPDGKMVAWCAASHLYAARLPASPLAHHNLGRTHFFGVAFHPSGGFFASCNGDGKVDYWDARTGEHLRALDWGVGKLNALAFDATGDRAACCGKTGQVVVWDVDR